MHLDQTHVGTLMSMKLDHKTLRMSFLSKKLFLKAPKNPLS